MFRSREFHGALLGLTTGLYGRMYELIFFQLSFAICTGIRASFPVVVLYSAWTALVFAFRI